MGSSVSDFSCCRLCPRQCGVDRLSGQTGFCAAGQTAEIYRYGPHHGEEPPISGANGSGTVFFSRCTLACLYCQNYPWSQEGEGTEYSVKEVAQILAELREADCHNWNLVSPTPWLPIIRDAVEQAAEEVDRLAVVFNSSGYETQATLSDYKGLADIYLVDLRYAHAASAKAGSGAADYVDVARDALVSMVDQVGPLRLDENGIAVSGVVCRLLILPGLADEAVESLTWIHTNLGTEIPVSIMAQYSPAYRARELEGWNRGIDKDEYDLVCAAVDRLGFENGWMQDWGEGVQTDLLGYEMAAGGSKTSV